MHYKWAWGSKTPPNISGGHPSNRNILSSEQEHILQRSFCRFKAAGSFCLPDGVFWSRDKLRNEGRREQIWLKSAHDSFINQLPERVGGLNEVWWLWIMHRTATLNRGSVVDTLYRCSFSGWMAWCELCVNFVVTVGVSQSCEWAFQRILSRGF